ncbi:4-hydroxythreonine-4-phosphate dehydrogenase PdxA [Spirulina subsalsa FACHB-351]|uniref:4-hydroxythreonine-4-phosphate dehydrogenase n=1 Tax=Spirulina subsalsa FACHB-351 TaxID=234711 RepID=A0ABT3L8X7_9CYAN|nr:4-hydroxythreonine-4-phosphate dehydrogenase PdxA [Spirulina subsalsa]MCW6037958.1 4-hydroxythreonine-4-phosphate dehydrogenase PdxA [Spirulina subsalsa FACHB-351]
MISFSSFRPALAVTMGDPASIGPEVVLKALADPSLGEKCTITLVGSRRLFQEAYGHLRGLGLEAIANPEDFPMIDLPIAETQIQRGVGSAASGEASFIYLKEAIAQTLTGHFQGIVTAPIAKSLWQAAGYDYPGQTEVLAQGAGVDRYGMLFVARSPYTQWQLITLLATTHIPLRQVPDTLTPELLSDKLDLLIHCLQKDFGIHAPKIVISGLNPHSGEQGKLGTEERDLLIPWLQKERLKYPNISLVGLVPPDTLWIHPAQAWYGHVDRTNIEPPPSAGNTRQENTLLADAYLALYHDQGLIPVKLMAFEQAINTTIGLPFIRTSPDHGTAFDIAGKGIAKAASMKAAIELAAELARFRKFSQI